MLGTHAHFRTEADRQIESEEVRGDDDDKFFFLCVCGFFFFFFTFYTNSSRHNHDLWTIADVPKLCKKKKKIHEKPFSFASVTFALTVIVSRAGI